jgi:uncharacterized membrane protein
MHMSGEQKKLQNNTAVMVRQETFSGPLPPPEILGQYNEIVPGLADRIVKMAESQSSHRQKLESRVVWFDGIRTMFGLIFGLVVALAGIVGGAELILGGHSLTGLASILLPLGAIVGAFVYQQRPKKEQD